MLNSVAKEGDHWESYVLRIIFAVVLGCHIPFIFFTGKESTLIIIDEFNRKSISRALQEKVQQVTRGTGEYKTSKQIKEEKFFGEVKQDVIDFKKINPDGLTIETDIDFDANYEQNMRTPTDTESSSSSRRSSMAYKEMQYTIYFFATTGLYFG